MNPAIRQVLTTLFETGVAAARGEDVLTAHSSLRGDAWHYDGPGGPLAMPLPPKAGEGRVLVFGAGKAAASLALGLERVLGDRIDDGVVIVKHGHREQLRRVRILEASHPVPDQSCLDATEGLLRALRSTTAADTIFFVLSGGASSLLVKPAPGLSLDVIQATGRLLVNSGAAIDEINTVRKHVSAISGGRLRLHAALEKVAATALITTPCGAMDFLSRLHLEFLLDPLDLELRHILLVGEIPSPGSYRQLAAEFEASVRELYADPFFGVPIAQRAAGVEALTPVRDGLLGLAPLDKDAVLDAPYAAGLAEIVVTPGWHSGLADTTLRTGQIVRLAGGEPGVPAPAHTVGEHVLIRGRWVSVPRLAAALARIDGISHWDLRIAREGTLDAAALHVTYGRAGLVENPMWRKRIAQAIYSLTPVSIDVVVEPETAEQRRPGTVTDLRGHHLGTDRAQVT